MLPKTRLVCGHCCQYHASIHDILTDNNAPRESGKRRVVCVTRMAPWNYVNKADGFNKIENHEMLRAFIQSINKIWTTENALLIFFENGYFALVFFCNLIALSVPSPFFLWRFELKTFISNSFFAAGYKDMGHAGLMLRTNYPCAVFVTRPSSDLKPVF